jgi:hypothetical protein
VAATPDSRKRLSEGALVEASVRARLLGIPLLRLDATIVLVPAGLRSSSPAPHQAGARTSAVPARSDGAGSGLAEAVRSIDEAAQVLADVRRNGS